MWSYLMDFIKQGENAGQADLSIQAMTLLNKVITRNLNPNKVIIRNLNPLPATY